MPDGSSNHHSPGTPIDCSCFICSGIAENDDSQKIIAGGGFHRYRQYPGFGWPLSTSTIYTFPII